MAGWGWFTKSKDPDLSRSDFDEATAFATMYRIGDNLFNSPDHHGTKRGRLNAFLSGFDFTEKDTSGQVQYIPGLLLPIMDTSTEEVSRLDQAYDEGLKHVMKVEIEDKAQEEIAKKEAKEDEGTIHFTIKSDEGR